jgi:DNA-binding transcriptional ArsR family regulator
MKAQSSLKYLFVSETRRKLVDTFFYFPENMFYVRELVRKIDEEINSVRHQLENLKKAGLISSERRGNRLYYSANTQAPIFNDMLVLAHKTTGLGLALQEKKEKLGKIKLFICSYEFVTGSQKADSVDFIIVGDVSINEVDSLIKEEEKLLGREINYMVMDQQELQIRRSKRDPFIIDFFLDCPIVIIGSPQEIRQS